MKSMSAQEISDRHNASLKPGVGHNSKNAAGDQLRAFVERVEKLEEEKKAIADDIRDVLGEARGNGFDVKAIRSLVKLRKVDPEKREAEEAVLDKYKHALGMI